MDAPSSVSMNPATPPRSTNQGHDPAPVEILGAQDDQMLYMTDFQMASPLFEYSNISSGGTTYATPNDTSPGFPLLFSTPPTAAPNGTFSLRPSFRDCVFPADWGLPQTEEVTNVPHSQGVQASLDSSPFQATVEASPVPSTTFSSPFMFLSDTVNQTRNVSENPVVNSLKGDNGRKGSPALSRVASQLHRSSSPFLPTTTPKTEPLDFAVQQPTKSGDATKWHAEYLRASRELQALQKQFQGIQEENCGLKVENKTLRSDLKWALGLNHWLPKIQSQVHAAEISLASGNSAAAPTQPTYPRNDNNIVLPPIPAPVPNQLYSYDNFALAQAAFPQAASATLQRTNGSVLPHGMQATANYQSMSVPSTFTYSPSDQISLAATPGRPNSTSPATKRGKRTRLEID